MRQGLTNVETNDAGLTLEQWNDINPAPLFSGRRYEAWSNGEGFSTADPGLVGEENN